MELKIGRGEQKSADFEVSQNYILKFNLVCNFNFFEIVLKLMFRLRICKARPALLSVKNLSYWGIF